MAKGTSGGGSRGAGSKGSGEGCQRLEGWQGTGGLAFHDGQCVRGWTRQRTIEEIGGDWRGIAVGERAPTLVGG